MMRRGPRGPYNKFELTENERVFREKMLDGAVEQVMKAKSKMTGPKKRLPYGFMNTLLADLKKQPLLKDATRLTINNHEQRFLKKLKDDKNANIKSDAKTIKDADSNTNDSTNNDTSNDDTDSCQESKKGGRPKGSTKASKHALKQRKEDAAKWAATQLLEKKEAAGGQRLEPYTLNRTVEAANKRFKLTDVEVLTYLFSLVLLQINYPRSY